MTRLTCSCVLMIGLGWPLTVAAQEHATARDAAHAAARPQADASRDSGKHPAGHDAAPPARTARETPAREPAAKEPAGKEAAVKAPAAKESAAKEPAAKEPAKEPKEPVAKTAARAPEAHVEGAAPRGERTAVRPAARPATTKELDLVMDRISRRISELGPGDGGRRAVATEPEETAPRPPARPAARKAAADRVRIEWKPTIVWPSAVLPDPAAAAAGEPEDGTVRLKWGPLK